MIVRFQVYTLILFMFLSPLQAESHHPQEFLKSIKGSKTEGEQIYQHFCVNCHSQKPLIAIGAPRIAEEGDWKIRMKAGLDELFKHTDEGMNGMPPRGGCFECSDKQLWLAIDYLVPKTYKKELLNKLRAH